MSSQGPRGAARKEQSGRAASHYSPAFGSHRRCWTLDWAPNGRMLVSGGMDKLVKVWDVTGRRCLAELEGHGQMVRGVAWSSNGTAMASVSDDCSVHMWNIRAQ